MRRINDSFSRQFLATRGRFPVIKKEQPSPFKITRERNNQSGMGTILEGKFTRLIMKEPKIFFLLQGGVHGNQGIVGLRYMKEALVNELKGLIKS